MLGKVVTGRLQPKTEDRLDKVSSSSSFSSSSACWRWRRGLAQDLTATPPRTEEGYRRICILQSSISTAFDSSSCFLFLLSSPACASTAARTRKDTVAWSREESPPWVGGAREGAPLDHGRPTCSMGRRVCPASHHSCDAGPQRGPSRRSAVRAVASIAAVALAAASRLQCCEQHCCHKFGSCSRSHYRGSAIELRHLWWWF